METTKTALEVPSCIAIIPDGNRRWARAKGIPQLEGHRAGYQKFKEVAKWGREKGVRHVLFFAFSTENWNRPPEEVSYLKDLLRWVLEKEVDEFARENVRLRVIGETDRYDEGMRELIRRAEEKTKENTGGTIGILLSYGGRSEIVHAAQKIAEEKISPEEISEESFRSRLWAHDIPDPDVFIRPGGEKRISNFLIWELAYSELFFSDTLWPDFSRDEFEKILKEYGERERRFGK